MPWLRRRESSTSEGSSSTLSLCSRSLSRKSWPCRKPLSEAGAREFDDLEEISQPAARLTRRSLAGPPVGGGQFGSLLLSTSAADLVLTVQFEDVIVEALLARIFEHLSLQDLLISAAGVNRRWYALATSDLVWKPRLQVLPNWDALQSLAPTYGSLQRTVARVCSFNLLANPHFRSSAMSSRSVGLLVKGTRKLGGKRCWQVRMNTWGTCDLPQPVRGEAVPQLLPELSNRSLSNPRPPSCLVLASPAWGAPEAVQSVDLFAQLVQRGLKPSAAAAWLDTSPPLAVSVWVRVGSQHRGAQLEGSAVVVLDNGQDKGAATSEGWEGIQRGSMIQANKALGYWISWAPDDSLLRGCHRQPTVRMETPRGTFRRVSTIFAGYRRGLRRAHFLLKGVHPSSLMWSGGKSPQDPAKASAEFLAPRMHFILPPSQLQPPALDLAGNILSTSSMLGNGGNILSTGGGVLDTMDTGGALETGEDFLATGCWQEA